MEDTIQKKQYDELLKVYAQKKYESQGLNLQLTAVKNQTNQIRTKIANFVPPVVQIAQIQPTGDLERQLQQLTAQLEGLSTVLKQEEAQAARSSQELTKSIQQLQDQHRLIQSNSHQSKNKIDNREAEEAASLLSSKKTRAQQQSHILKELQSEILNQTRALQQLEREVAELNILKSGQLNKEKNNQGVNSFEDQLRLLQIQQRDIESAIQKEINAQQIENKKREAEGKDKNHKLDQVRTQNSELISTLRKLQLESNTKYNDKTGDLQREIKNLEQAHKSVLKEIDGLHKQISVKKQQEVQKKEDAKKEKNKDKKNYKQQTAEEQNLSEILSRQLERQKSKLEDTVKLRKSYVSSESLQILQKQYERHQLKNKPNLQVQLSKSEKVLKERELIKSRIQFLKQSTKGLQAQSEKSLRELRAKGDELVKDKLANEKDLNETTYKLNQYLKVFPDHEKKKQQAKNQQKRRRHEAKEKAKEKARQQQRNKELLKQKINDQSLLDKPLNDDPSKPKWQQWDDWDKAGNLSKRDQQSIFNNKQFQLIAAAIAVIAILTLSFS